MKAISLWAARALKVPISRSIKVLNLFGFDIDICIDKTDCRQSRSEPKAARELVRSERIIRPP
jgi:hypothetical protein